MPTKTLVASAYAAHLARRSAEYGIAMESPVRIDMRRVKARADTVPTNARTNIEKWLRGMDGLTVIEGHARFKGPDAVQVGDFSQGDCRQAGSEALPKAVSARR
jgi:pyruvate/2-oxoglutarate dehydrogenase complex dihydrolipoamide dehydrogenase (E3) component